MANDSFIDHRCQICGGTDIADMALSEVIVNAGYGSKHDGQQLRLVVCGKCADKILSVIETNVENLNRLMNTYQSIMFDVDGKQEHFCKFVCDWNKQKDAIICVNPAVIYAGTAVHRLDIMKLFFNENPGT